MGSILAAIVAGTVAAAAGDVPRQELQLNAVQMFKLAEVRQAAGDLTVAAQLYAALEADPDRDIRAEARFRHAKLLLASRRTTEAAVLLRHLIDERPDATAVRLQLAQLLDGLGDKDAAWREIRAIQASGLPPSVARLVDRYSEALRAARPFGANFEVAVAPDSNINHATSEDHLGTVFGDFDIGKESKARSGTGMALRGQVYRRFSFVEQGPQLLVRMSGFGNVYKQSRFNDLALDLAGGPELSIGRSRINVEVGATQRWFGQRPYMRSLRLGASVIRPLGRRTEVRLTGAGALIDNWLNDLQDGRTFSGEVGIERALSATAGVALISSLARESLKDLGYSTTSWHVGLLGWKDIGRVTLTANGEVGRLRGDERLALFPEARSDRLARLSIAARVRRFNFGGFAPVARFVIERNRSTIAFYDYSRRRTEFGFERAF